MFFLSECALARKPRWVSKKLDKYEFKGIATNKRTREGAEHDASNNGVRKIMESIGIRARSEYESTRRGKGDLFEIEVPDLNREVITLGDDGLRRILLSVGKSGKWDAKSIDFYIVYAGLFDAQEGGDFMNP